MKYLVFLGSNRDSSPPRPRRLGQRVAASLLSRLAGQGHDVSLIDVMEYKLEPPFKPHFAYAQGKAPPQLEELSRQIVEADGYVMVSPEYNHSMSPALADLLNHFGASLFSWKPSVIATYSAGQWGGTRAAVNMRTFLAELGCLPVSAMIHIPKAQEVFDEEGHYLEGVDGKAWTAYLDRGLSQLVWWSGATSHWRTHGPDPSEAFLTDPSQRNAPS